MANPSGPKSRMWLLTVSCASAMGLAQPTGMSAVRMIADSPRSALMMTTAGWNPTPAMRRLKAPLPV